jgi:hypothetical protein
MKFVETFQFWLKSGKHNGLLYIKTYKRFCAKWLGGTSPAVKYNKCNLAYSLNMTKKLAVKEGGNDQYLIQ